MPDNSSTASRQPDNDIDASPALLALKRFIRGPLRQFGLGMLSLLLVFSLTAHRPASFDQMQPDYRQKDPLETSYVEQNPVQIEHRQPGSETKSLSTPPMQTSTTQTSTTQTSTTQTSTAQTSTTQTATTAVKPRRVLVSKMTNHRLTGARLSLPSGGKSEHISKHRREVVSVTASKLD